MLLGGGGGVRGEYVTGRRPPVKTNGRGVGRGRHALLNLKVYVILITILQKVDQLSYSLIFYNNIVNPNSMRLIYCHDSFD